MTYEDECFDIVFISNLLDLIKRPLDVVSECHRILKPGGVIVHHYAALEDILKDPEHKFFPEIIELDYLRTPARKQVETWFRDAHLKDINSERNTYRLWKNAQERLATVEGKASSGLRLLSFDAFNTGLSKLRSYAASNPMDPWLRDSTVTTTYGRK
jgi:SAM-dependent methyltransferase